MVSRRSKLSGQKAAVDRNFYGLLTNSCKSNVLTDASHLFSLSTCPQLRLVDLLFARTTVRPSASNHAQLNQAILRGWSFHIFFEINETEAFSTTKLLQIANLKPLYQFEWSLQSL